MLDLKRVINETELVKRKLALRGADTSQIDKIVELSKKRSEVMTSMQSLEADRNKLSKEIGQLKASGQDADDLLKQVSDIKAKIENIKDEEMKVNETINDMLLFIPNLVSDNVPEGKDEDENIVIAEHGNLGRGKVTGVKAHYDVAVDLDIVDFERAVKLSGARFWAYKGLGSRLVRALENFMLDTHGSKGYTEWRPPVIVKSNIMQGTGQLPKFKEDLFKLEGTDSYLIPTAEVPLTNLHNGEILDLSTPIAYTAFTPCFRAEAGSGGKDMRGLIRAHQFNKVELVKFVSERDLQVEYKKTIGDAKAILEALELPYQELQLCSGDVGFSAEETVDLEVWIPSENKYREISSVSSFSDFQGRRASIRYKNEEGKNQAAFTINGSGLAIDRTVAAILENYQNEDGSISVPKVLVPYMGGIELIK